LLTAAMAAATIPLYVLGILATFIIDDLGITRGEVGLGVTVNVVLAALLSPSIGRLVDRMGGRWSLLALFATSAAGLGLIAGARAYLWLLGGSVVAAVAQAFGNPATNKLIAVRVPAGRRGLITGLKQSGVQVGLFVGGLLLPPIASAIGWRAAILLVAAVAVSMIIPGWLLPSDRTREAGSAVSWRSHDPSVYWLAGYGFLLGFGGSANVFFALFVEEALGGTPERGGVVVAVAGFVAIGARVGVARLAERRNAYTAMLGGIAAFGILTFLLLLAATTVPWLVWAGAVMYGLSVASWNSVGMLAVIAGAGPMRAGGASGIVMLGFLGGIGAGAPILGWTVDVTDAYTTAWVLAGATMLGGLFTIAGWRRRGGRVTVADSTP
jgi:predicted MFS family arabinose efflux permease